MRKNYRLALLDGNGFDKIFFLKENRKVVGWKVVEEALDPLLKFRSNYFPGEI